jgi:hypothetical protein
MTSLGLSGRSDCSADPESRSAFGVAGRRVVRDRFNVDLVVDRYDKVFRSLGFAVPRQVE